MTNNLYQRKFVHMFSVNRMVIFCSRGVDLTQAYPFVMV